MAGKPAFLSYSDFETILIAPDAFISRFPEDCSCFSRTITFGEIGQHIPLFEALKT